MSDPVTLRPSVVSIPLNRAAICLNDETVFPVAAQLCPVCGWASWMPLATWLGRSTE
jgi:hypothetical protein